MMPPSSASLSTLSDDAREAVRPGPRCWRASRREAAPPDVGGQPLVGRTCRTLLLTTGRRPGLCARAFVSRETLARSSGDVAPVRLRLVDPWAATDRHIEEDDTELDRAIGLVAPHVHARGAFDERVARLVGAGPAVVVVDGEGPGLHRDQGLAGVTVPAGRGVRADCEVGDDRIRARRGVESHSVRHGPD